MKRLMNFTAFGHDTDRYTDREDLRHFYKDRGLDGMELTLNIDAPFPEIIPQEDVVGVHLRMFPYWLDLWKGDSAALLKNFGTREAVRAFYQGSGRDAILSRLKKELKKAQALGAKYVVFHVSDVSFLETWSRDFSHSDLEVIQAACSLINTLLDDQDYTFEFLVENLWWPGFTMTNPNLTRYLMDHIHYANKGIMLDVGHLLHTNLDLADTLEGAEYIKETLKRHGGLTRYIRGMHLHQSITGDYVKTMLQSHPYPESAGDKLFWETMGHIYNMDVHLPWTQGDIAGIIASVDPAYLVIEFVTADRKEHGDKLDAQLKALE